MKVSLWAEIRRLYEMEGLKGRAIARRLHCCTKTVSKALAMTAPAQPPAGPFESILDPYRAQIDALLTKYPDLSAVRVLEEISRGEDGYQGSVYPLRRYLCRVRPARGRVYQEVIYEPGEAMHVDWGDCGRLVIGQAGQREEEFDALGPAAREFHLKLLTMPVKPTVHLRRLSPPASCQTWPDAVPATMIVPLPYAASTTAGSPSDHRASTPAPGLASIAIWPRRIVASGTTPSQGPLSPGISVLHRSRNGSVATVTGSNSASTAGGFA